MIIFCNLHALFVYDLHNIPPGFGKNATIGTTPVDIVTKWTAEKEKKIAGYHLLFLTPIPAERSMEFC